MQPEFGVTYCGSAIVPAAADKPALDSSSPPEARASHALRRSQQSLLTSPFMLWRRRWRRQKRRASLPHNAAMVVTIGTACPVQARSRCVLRTLTRCTLMQTRYGPMLAAPPRGQLAVRMRVALTHEMCVSSPTALLAAQSHRMRGGQRAPWRRGRPPAPPWSARRAAVAPPCPLPRPSSCALRSQSPTRCVAWLCLCARLSHDPRYVCPHTAGQSGRAHAPAGTRPAAPPPPHVRRRHAAAACPAARDPTRHLRPQLFGRPPPRPVYALPCLCACVCVPVCVCACVCLCMWEIDRERERERRAPARGVC
jgi:hypothetical protein